MRSHNFPGATSHTHHGRRRGGTGSRFRFDFRLPFGHEVTGSTGKQPEVRALRDSLGVDPKARAGALGRISFMEKDLLGSVIPLVEKEYRVEKEVDKRANNGYSMGGMQASTIGLNHPEVFAHVGAKSGNAREAADARRVHGEAMGDL